MGIPVQSVYSWQQEVWNTLTQRFPKLGQALLLYGQDGCGKLEFTQTLVAWILCTHKQPEHACGECVSCQWLKSSTHPNYIHVTTDEEHKKKNHQIKIEKIRELAPFVQQTGGEGWRVIVIEPAQALNIASSNALLKTLEEPSERVILILVANHYLSLPATIRSRVQRFALDRISFKEALSYLQYKQADLSMETAKLLLNLSAGMPLQALEINQSNWFGQRKAFLYDWEQLAIQKNTPITLSTKWSKELSFFDFICMFEYLLGDLICVKLNQPVKNIDLALKQLTSLYALKKLFDLYQEVILAKQLIDQNVQSNLILDELFIKLMNIDSIGV